MSHTATHTASNNYRTSFMYPYCFEKGNYSSNSRRKELYVESSKSGYTYFGARYYDADLSVWLSVDPLSDMYPSLSSYSYVLNNPIVFYDPNGEDVWIFITKTKSSYSGHVIIGVTEYKDGKKTGNVLIYELYPVNEDEIEGDGIVSSSSIPLSTVSSYAQNNSEIYLKLETNKEEDEVVWKTLNEIEKKVNSKEQKYNAESYNCTSIAVFPLQKAKIDVNSDLGLEKGIAIVLPFSVHSPNKLWNDLLGNQKKIFDSNKNQKLELGKIKEYIELRLSEKLEGTENL